MLWRWTHNSYSWPHPAMVKISFKKSRIRISTKIERFFASETFYPQKFEWIRRQLLVFVKFVKKKFLSRSDSVKNACISVPYHCQNLLSRCSSHISPLQKYDNSSTTFFDFGLLWRQTDSQTKVRPSHSTPGPGYRGVHGCAIWMVARRDI